MSATLAEFHRLRTIFEEVGIRPEGFALPRQHALVHYVRSIQLFGSPNGLCSSITESRHITAVKRPWRRSSRKNALGQILRTLTRLNKLAATRVEFARRGMLRSKLSDYARRMAGQQDAADADRAMDEQYRHEAEAMAAAEPYSESASVCFPTRPSTLPHLNLRLSYMY